MLDKNSLSQLQSLKQNIHDSTPRFSGVVRGSQGRFGFVDNDSGQSFFLAPSEMEKVFAGDVIKFRVESQEEGKQQAIVESLENSDIDDLIGRYIIRGKGHFIVPDHEKTNRWIFVPPKQRNSASDGDYVRAKLHKHPFPDTKAQAEIVEVIGSVATPGIEKTIICQKYDLKDEISSEVDEHLNHLCQLNMDALFADRTDLSHLPFVTIDSAGTRDIDDALYAEAQSDGWNLWIAIADPAALIDPATPLDDHARQRATSVYFPDQVIPMLPSKLSEQLCSLQANEPRLALVVELRIGEDGSVRHTAIHNSKICSRAKLSYTQVAQFIESNNDDISAELRGPLLHLWDCARALKTFRQDHCLVLEDRPDYKLILNDEQQISDIVRIERNAAHHLVEECMLACNRSVADWLAERSDGFFINHGGVRTERAGDVMALLVDKLALEKKPKLSELDSYIKIMQQVAEYEGDIPLRSVIAKQQDRSLFKLDAKPHMGLGFKHYTTFTSPLRRYNDLLIHRLVKAQLLAEKESQIEVTDSELAEIQIQQIKARKASGQIEQWLKLNWLRQHTDADDVHTVTIVHQSNHQMTCRFEETSIEGVIDCRNSKKSKGPQWVFDGRTLELHRDETRYLLGDKIEVKIAQIEPENRLLKLQLAQ